MADNLFGDLGFPQMSQEDMIKQRTQQQTKLFQELIADHAAALPAQDRGVFQAFAQLGRNAFGKPVAELTADEKQKLGIMQTANERIRKLKADPLWNQMDSYDKALASQEAIAKSALDMGDITTFTQLAQRVGAQRIAKRRSNMEAKKLGIEVESGELALRGEKATIDPDEEAIQYVLPEADGSFNFSNPSQIVTGRRNRQGQLELPDGTVMDNYMDMAAWETVADVRSRHAEALASGSATMDERWKMFKDGFGTGELNKYRMSYRDALTGSEMVTSMFNSLDGFMAQGGDLEQVVGTGGGFTKGVNSMWSAMKGVGKGFSEFVNVGGTKGKDGYYSGGENLSLTQAADRWLSDADLPPGIKEGSAEASRYKATVMRLVYMDARLAEPGARQLSDADIENAKSRLGVGTSSPTDMVSTLMMSYLDHSHKSALNATQQVMGSATGGFNIDRGVASRRMFGVDDWQKGLTEAYRSVESAGQRLLGRLGAANTLPDPEAETAEAFTGPVDNSGFIDQGDGFGVKFD